MSRLVRMMRLITLTTDTDDADDEYDEYDNCNIFSNYDTHTLAEIDCVERGIGCKYIWSIPFVCQLFSNYTFLQLALSLSN